MTLQKNTMSFSTQGGKHKPPIAPGLQFKSSVSRQELDYYVIIFVTFWNTLIFDHNAYWSKGVIVKLIYFCDFINIFKLYVSTPHSKVLILIWLIQTSEINVTRNITWIIYEKLKVQRDNYIFYIMLYILQELHQRFNWKFYILALF